MKYPPDQFLAALRATRCPEALLGAAARINVYGPENLRHELVMLAWQRALEVSGRDVETLFPNEQTALLTTLPPTLADPDLTRITVPEELLLERAGLDPTRLTPGQQRALRSYCSSVERAYREFQRREAPALSAWIRASQLIEPLPTTPP